ncbi:LLM class flavin-dependent oxidoreductase [Nocardia sp. CA2R105]|uniref:LLM class flavin-dependent oxidoreductase n=1 Tax=Nocardia coffeae TaxID=2873381 RepID=UPI001CA622D8|nr:LLM class flavin-dependent oxidoreductase [Nocardia coffeae]MBY8862931.1 LLM class flavin-dependent oxidoreductase [Nocardia coffeae]
MGQAVKFGVSGIPFPPIVNVLAAAKSYEQSGYDFILEGDQLNFTIPRSMWTPDIVKAADKMDVDWWMDPWVLASAQALVTEKIQFCVLSDALRRTPVNLAQLLLSMDHVSNGRTVLTTGAGEVKQFTPYGIPRKKPFGHLEECVKIIKMFCDSSDPIDYEGPIWNLKDAILALPPVDKTRTPDIWVAGGPGRSIEITGKHADGWMSYFPGCGSAEQFAELRAGARRHAEEAGRDPDSLSFCGLFLCLLEENEAAVEELTHNLALRWDAAVMAPSGASWRQWNPNNPPHPLGDDFSYARDLIPMEWERDEAIRIAESVPPEVVRQSKFTGMPEQVAAQIAPYLKEGITHCVVVNYGQAVTTGDWGESITKATLLLDTNRHLGMQVNPATANA